MRSSQYQFQVKSKRIAEFEYNSNTQLNMFVDCIKHLSAVGVFLLLAIIAGTSAQSAEDELPCRGACPIRYRCSSEEKVVWATDNQTCSVFLNECHLKSINCIRVERCEKELTSVDKEECQKKCPTICTLEYSPVCAEYKDEKKEFSNNCALKSHICQTGQVWNLYRQGAC